MYGWIAAVALAAALAAAGWITRDMQATLDHKRQELVTAQANLKEFQNAYEVTSTVLTQRAESKSAIKESTKNVLVEIERRIPVDSGLLPPDWRLLHDSAASGSPVPNPPLGTDASPVPAKDAAVTVTENYGICRDTADQLVLLQQWIRGVSK